LEVLGPGQEISLIYGGPPVSGSSFMSICGRAVAPSREEAVDSALQMWRNIALVFGMRDWELLLEPPEPTREDRRPTWQTVIKPLGVAVKVARAPSVGFVRQCNHRPDSETSVLLAASWARFPPTLDFVTRLGAGGLEDARVVARVRRIALSECCRKKIAQALEWLDNGRAKQIAHESDVAAGDDRLLAALYYQLTLWLKNPAGFRVTYLVESFGKAPPPAVEMLGREIYGGQRTLKMSREVPSEEDQRWYSEDSICTGASLDLRDSVNIASPLPPLLPSLSEMEREIATRVYRHRRLPSAGNGLLLGQAVVGRRQEEIRLSPAARTRATYVLGATGTGKSTLLSSMIAQDIRSGEGVCLIDPHGDLYARVIELIPEERAGDVVLIDPCDPDFVAGINFLEIGEGRFRHMRMNFVVNELISIFDRLYDLRVTGGPMFEQYMRGALILVLDSRVGGATLMDVPLVFEDKSFRSFLLENCDNPYVVSFWKNQAERAGGDASLASIAPYVTSKLNQFTTNELLRPIIGQPRTTIDFREAIANRKILMVNLSKGLLGELDSQLLGMLLIGKIFTAAMGRVTVDRSQRTPFYLYIDECQNILSDTLAYMLSESRKFGLSIVLANQNLAQIAASRGRQSILESVLANCGNFLFFRVGVSDAERIAAYTRPELDAQDLEELPDHYVAARILVKGTPCRPFVFRTLRFDARPGSPLAPRIAEVSRRRYGRPRAEVEKEIKERMTCREVTTT
jgi:hypothetical protein